MSTPDASVPLSLPTASQLAAQISRGELSPPAALESALERAEAGRALNALISLNPHAAEQAAQVATRLAAGETLPLAGVPIIIKDNLNLRGTRTTCGSRMLEGYVSPYTATAEIGRAHV